MEFTPYNFLTPTTPEAITRIRKTLKLTQAQFGSLLGSHAVTVNRWEKAKLKPTPYQIALIQKFEAACKVCEHDIADTIVAKGAIPALFLLLKSAFEDK